MRAGSAGGSLRLLSPRLVIALVALLAALAAATVSGAIRLDRLPNPFRTVSAFASDGVSLDYPDGWHQLTPDDPHGMSAGMTSLIVSNRDVDSCNASEMTWATPNVGVLVTPAPGESGGDIIVEPPEPPGPTYSAIDDQIFACLLDEPMAPGELRVTLSFGPPQEIGVGPIEPFDPTAWFGPAATLGDMPFTASAQRWRVAGPRKSMACRPSLSSPRAPKPRLPLRSAPGASMTRSRFDSIWFIRSSLRGPDLDDLRAQADAIAKSLHFDARPPVLDASRRDEALAKAINRIDQEQRQQGSRMVGCFPRTPGEQTALIEEGPGGPLLEPATVTCTTTIEETPLHLWRAVLRMTWPAGDGYPAGTLGWELFFGIEEDLGAQGWIGDRSTVVFPGTTSPTAPPLDGPVELAPGTIVQMLAPGIRQSDPLVTDSWNNPHPDIDDRFVYEAQPGRRFAVVDGPITHNDAVWYLVEAMMGVSYPGDFVWLPATDGDRLLVRVEEPACPASPSVVDLVYLLPAERVSCYEGQELTLAPAFAAKVHRDTTRPVPGTPAWLSDSQWRLYGEDGPSGLEGPLLVAVDPSVGDSLPTDVPLTVTGHFGDPAAATCDGQVPEGLQPETPEMQHRRCSEVFVITAIEEGAAQ